LEQVDKSEVNFTSERIIMQHTRLTKLTSNQLHNLLTKRYRSPARIAEIKQWVENRKKAINTARVQKQVIKKRWARIIKPLTKRDQRSKVSEDIPRGQEPPTLFVLRGLPRFLNHPTRADGNAEKQEWQDATREQDRALD